MENTTQTATGTNLTHTAFPLGGLGAGMVCLEGNGALNHLSVNHTPELYRNPGMFATIHIKGDTPVSRVVEGPVQPWKIYGPTKDSGNGIARYGLGLPRFTAASFSARFPFAEVALAAPDIPVRATVTGWSPFIPGNDDESSLPVAALEYTFKNESADVLEMNFGMHTRQFIKGLLGSCNHQIVPAASGLCLAAHGTEKDTGNRAAFTIAVPHDDAIMDYTWFRDGWFNPVTMLWNNIATGKTPANPPCGSNLPAPGASIHIPLVLHPGETVTMPVLLSWHVPQSRVRVGHGNGFSGPGCCPTVQPGDETYRPRYVERFNDAGAVNRYWLENYDNLKRKTVLFSDTLHAASLPPEIRDAVTANLSILKSPTLLRQHDGRLWAWEGCCDNAGCCHGSCTHVWNYAQALPHLFPALERSLRQTEFNECQDGHGHQNFRAPLPIGPADHKGNAAADGQLGGIIKMYRDWRICGDTDWLTSYWNKLAASIDYCISTWDPHDKGVLEEPHHNTYDIDFWGPDGMCSSIYVNALDAMARMGAALDKPVARYTELRDKGKAYIESELWNGEYFIQNITWKGLHSPPPYDTVKYPHFAGYAGEVKKIIHAEGPKYQYGTGCLSDGVIGEWMAACAGLPGVLDKEKVESHLIAIHRYNFKSDLTGHANPQRAGYAMEGEGGLLLCTWPRGGRPSLPFVYSDEVWTGIEYQVASHLTMLGHADKALEIVRAARNRYDGTVRNPFNEYECGHWYGRALASYSLLQAYTGVRYDAVEKTLYMNPAADGDFTTFIATATGYGLTGVRDGEPFIDIVHGTIIVDRINSNDDN